VLCDNFVSRWDNDDVEKLSPWDLEPLEDCSMSTSRVCFFYSFLILVLYKLEIDMSNTHSFKVFLVSL